MSKPTVVLEGTVVEALPAGLVPVVRHLCESDCHTYGDLVEWCESRGDCTIAIICPSCEAQFLIEEDDLIVLEHWTKSNGITFGCGVVVEG